VIVGWAAWFIDLPGQRQITRHNNTNCAFEDLPRDGCLALVTFEDRTKPDQTHIKNVYKGYDYYFRADGLAGYLYACDLDSRERATLADIRARYRNPIVLRGAWTDRDTLQTVIDEVTECRLI
jgi:hypothetical protein